MLQYKQDKKTKKIEKEEEMKAKGAVKLFDNVPQEEHYQRMNELYRKEAKGRIEFRAHGRKPTVGLVEGVVKEMKLWCEKLAELIGMKKETVDLVTKSKSAGLYLDYGIEDPTITNLRIKVPFAIIRGQHPLEVITRGDLDALAHNMLARAAKEAEEMQAEYERTGKFPE